MIAAREWARRNARPSVVAMALLLATVVVALGYAVDQIVDGSSFHLASQLAGSDARFREILGASAYDSLSKGQVYGSLVLDGVLAVVYGFGLWFFLWTYWCQPFWRVARVLDLRRIVLLLPVLAATFDLLENVVTGFGLEWTTTGVHYRGDGWALAVATLSCLKWFALAGALIAALSTLVAVLRPRADRTAEPITCSRVGDRVRRRARDLLLGWRYPRRGVHRRRARVRSRRPACSARPTCSAQCPVARTSPAPTRRSARLQTAAPTSATTRAMWPAFSKEPIRPIRRAAVCPARRTIATSRTIPAASCAQCCSRSAACCSTSSWWLRPRSRSRGRSGGCSRASTSIRACTR